MATIVTGAAGFVGFFTAKRLLERGETVIGVDNFNAYYDTRLKVARAGLLAKHPRFQMIEMDIADDGAFGELVRDSQADKVVHLAAQAGVRYSLEAPFDYERSNLRGHLSVLEACRHSKRVTHLVYASSSSVYGARPQGEAFSEDDAAVEPVSLYAATKRSCELMSAAYARLYGTPQTGLRFFTVYGPFGRPDMAYFSFTRKILRGEPIEVYGEGKMARDFTYIDDIVDGVMGVIDNPANDAEHRVLNIGDNRPVALMTMIRTLEESLGVEAQKVFLPMQPGDVPATYADISKLNALCGYQPKVMLEEGLARFAAWYGQYYSADGDFRDALRFPIWAPRAQRA